MSKEINVFLPMRAGSERIPRKNTKKFSGIDGGLCSIKINQLLQCKSINYIFVSTNDQNVIDIANSFESRKIRIIKRPDELSSSSTSTDDLINYVPEIMPDGHILWTHVTSPFIGPDIYDKIIKTYFNNLKKYDSLMTVTKIQKFIWNDTQPINYDRSIEKWPRTQTLEPLWEINSGVFITTRKIYKKHMDRVGVRPYLFELSGDLAFDIDWMSDFTTAEEIYKRLNNTKLNTSLD